MVRKIFIVFATPAQSDAKIKLFSTFRERLIDSKTMLPLKGGEMHPSISRLDQ